MAIENLYSFPAGSNPFAHDLYHVGEKISDDIYMMYDHHKEYIIFVERSTGKRRRLDIAKLFSEEFPRREEVGFEDMMQVLLRERQ